MAPEAPEAPEATAPTRAQAVSAHRRALVMGILNVTPDSFSDGGAYLDTAAAIARGRAMVDEGADIVDVGGESTRPGAPTVAESEELARVIGVVEALAPHVRVSIDTTKPAVARAALDAGATIVNDVSASLEAVAGGAGAGWIAMHRRGDSATMQGLTGYDDVVGEVRAYLRDAAARGSAAGVAEMWVDPGIGFAKTAAQSFALLAHLDALVADGVPVLVGASRKSFLGNLASGPHAADERLEASLAVAVWAVEMGAAAIRVHDVAETVAAVTLLSAI